MNAKKKIAQSIITMFSMVLIVVFSLVLALSMPDIQNNARAKAFVSYGVAATVSGNYYVGSNSYKMYSGENDKITFDSFDDESCPALNIKDDIKLSSKNNYVVFEYKFKNDSNENSFITQFSNVIETENMDVTYAYSYEKLSSFDKIDKKSIEDVPVFRGSSNTLYLYIKAKISDLNHNSKLSGLFCFNLTVVDVCEIYMIDGVLGDKIYAPIGFKMNDIKVPQLFGMKFEGYFTKLNGKGEMIFDENGQAQKVLTDDSIKVLYAHYSKI